MTRIAATRFRKFLPVLGILFLLTAAPLPAQTLPLVADVESQPLKSQAQRVAAALKHLGHPLTQVEQAQLTKALDNTNDSEAIAAIQKTLDRRALMGVHINAESRVKVTRGAAPPILTEQGWSVFLVKVHNEAGVTSPLRCSSVNAEPLQKRSRGASEPESSITAKDIPNRWLDLLMFEQKPLTKTLSGLELDYRIIQLYSRDAGKREGLFLFDVGQGTQDLGFRSELPVLFTSRAAAQVTLNVIDHDGTPTTGQFVIRDQWNRVYPARARRLAPDFFFHDQIYRHSGETVSLPPGQYQVTFTRGPEYTVQRRTVTVPDARQHQETFRLKRWIKLTDYSWYSGDHHVHAAGCSHYEAPTQGVSPEDMMRHFLGEDLNVGCVLTWGPCWYHQKQFFEGQLNALSQKNYLMRYDVEVSGFPSSHTGHLCLLRLKEDDYPNTTRIEEWPSWDLPVLKWGKEQGGVVGFSHSGWGLKVEGDTLPNYNMPKFDSIGANEYIVDVVHGVCDFISAVDTPIIWEMSIWYHTLNCGYTCRISGETDFPCIYGDRVGLGRVYVKLDKDQPLNFDNWVYGLRDGRSYCSDGLAHLFDFQVNSLGVGETGKDKRPSFLGISQGDALKINVKAAAHLEKEPLETVRSRPLDQKPYWHVERARVGNTRKVPVELIVNGEAVAKTEINADGSVQPVSFDYTLQQSSWVALRIFPAAHTNPVFVEVDGKPIRASKRSAQWCLEAVDVCWNSKKGKIRKEEQEAAAAAYEQARQAYRKILEESFDDTK